MIRRTAALGMILASTLSLPASAEAIAIELNAAQAQGESCRLVFTAQTDAGVEELVLETAIFDGTGGVALLTLFDFMELPAGSLRVRQFDLPDRACSDLGALLFNGIDSCTGPGCEAGLAATSRVEALEVLQ